MSAASVSGAKAAVVTFEENFAKLWGDKSSFPASSKNSPFKFDTQMALKWMASKLMTVNKKVVVGSNYSLTAFTCPNPLYARIAMTAERVLMQFMEQYFKCSNFNTCVPRHAALLYGMLSNVEGFNFATYREVDSKTAHDSTSFVFGKEWWYSGAEHLKHFPIQYLSNLGWTPVLPELGIIKGDVVAYYFESSSNLPGYNSPVRLFGVVSDVTLNHIVIEYEIGNRYFIHRLDLVQPEFGDSVMFFRKTRNVDRCDYVNETLVSIWGPALSNLSGGELDSVQGIRWAVRQLAKHEIEESQMKEFPYYRHFINTTEVNSPNTRLKQAYPHEFRALIQATPERVLHNVLRLIYQEESMENQWKFLSHKSASSGEFLHPILDRVKDYMDASKARSLNVAHDVVYNEADWKLHCKDQGSKAFVPFLLSQKWTQVFLDECQKGDVVIYYADDGARQSLDYIMPLHTGTIYSVLKDGKVMVKSRDAMGVMILHELTIQPEEHGNAFMVLRRPNSQHTPIRAKL